MNIFLVGSLLLITLNFANTGPLPPKPFLDVIKEKCHSSVVETLFEQLKPLEHCPAWDKLNIIDKLTKYNEDDVLCLLFYDSFISFCQDIEKLHLSDVKLDLKVIHGYTPKQVCKNLFPANKILEHNISKTITPERCETLCADFDTEEPVLECSLAFYFAHFNMSSSAPKPHSSNSDTSNPVQHSNLEASSLAQQADTGVKKSSDVSAESKNEKHNIIDPTIQGAVDKNKPSNVNTELKDDKPPPAIVAKLDPIIEKPHDNSDGTKSNENPTDSDPGNVPGVPKNANGSVSGIQPQPNLTDDAHKNQKTVEESPQLEVEKPVKDQVSNHESSEDLPSQQKPIEVTKNKISGVAENTANEDALPNKGLEMGPNEDKINPEKGEGQMSDMEEEGFPGPDDDDDLGADIGMEKQEPVPEDAPVLQAASVSAVQRPKETEKSNTLETAANEENMEDLDGGSYFFSYFMVICVFFVLGYVGYHNRIKVMALVLEGKKNKRQFRGRRPNSANYHKLDSNLEEAISSTCTKNANNVIY